MTRRRSLTTGLFGMPNALTEAALEQLTPAQRGAITSDKAGDIMRLMVDTAEKVGRIIERQPPQMDKVPQAGIEAAAPSTRDRGNDRG